MNVTQYVDAWVAFLRGAEPMIGFPILLAGLLFVGIGWRMWTLASMASLGLIGGIVGQLLSNSPVFDPTWSIGGAVVFAVCALVLVNHSATVVGGLIGGTFVSYALESYGIHGYTQIAAAVLGFAAATAWADANRQRVVVTITSIEGGILVVSGVTILISAWPWLQGYLRSTASASTFVVPFFVLVPTVIGIALQLADSNRSTSKAVRG